MSFIRLIAAPVEAGVTSLASNGEFLDLLFHTLASWLGPSRQKGIGVRIVRRTRSTITIGIAIVEQGPSTQDT